MYEVLKVGNVHPIGKGMNGNVFDVNGGLCPTLTTNRGEGIKFLFNETEETGMNDLSMYAEYLVQATRERLGYDTYDDSNDDRVLVELQRGEKISKSKHVQQVKKSFTYASAFAGIGGMSLGLEPLGGEGVIAWEHDPTEKRRQYAQEAHRLLHPHIPIHGDICEANTDELPDFDVFCFTPPCQSFSVAGKRGGFEDTRGTLTFEALRIANAKRPKILFMENVKGLVNHDAGNTMGTILHAINEIGYTVDFTVLNSKYFDVAQNRERVYLLAVRDDLITPEPWIDVKGTTMLPKAKAKYLAEGVRSFNFDWPEQTEVRTRLRDFLEDGVDAKYYLAEDKTAVLVAQLESTGEPTINKDVKMIGHADIDGHDYNKRIYSVDGVSRCLNTASDIGRSTKIAEPVILHNIYGGFGEKKPRIFSEYSPTIRTSAGGGHLPSVLESNPRYRIRKLTPAECLKLQSVPSDAIETLKANFSDSRLYKFAGNGLTTNVIRAIGERLLTHL